MIGFGLKSNGRIPKSSVSPQLHPGTILDKNSHPAVHRPFVYVSFLKYRVTRLVTIDRQTSQQ